MQKRCVLLLIYIYVRVHVCVVTIYSDYFFAKMYCVRVFIGYGYYFFVKL